MPADPPVGWVKTGEMQGRKAQAQEETEHLYECLKDAGLYRLLRLIQQCGGQQCPRRCKCGADLGAAPRYCHQYLCVRCRRYKGYLISLEVEESLKELRKAYSGLKVFWGTFTLPNCEGEELKEQIKLLTGSFSKLMRRAEVKKYSLGAVRFVEISFDRKSDMYHPHVHCLLIFRASYNSKGYLSKQAWLDLWRAATGNSRISEVKIKPVRSDATKGFSVENNSAKATKYAMKPISAQKWTPKSILVLTKAIRRSRQFDFLGEIRAVRSQLVKRKPSCVCQNCLSLEVSASHQFQPEEKRS